MPDTLLTPPQAAMLHDVYYGPGWQFPDVRLRAGIALIGFGLVVNRGRNNWHVTQRGFDWMEAHPWTH